VVILGQDPYHGPGQAHGLSFSVQHGQPHPPSLQNIFKELSSDMGIARPQSGNLTPWAQRGVLLLNATLTVEAHRAGSHQNKGWEPFTDSIVRLLAAEKSGVVFILWGRYARAKESMIDRSKHAVVASAHPSPLSAHNGFFGSRPFSRTNEHLIAFGQAPIDWRLES
jgi:uracil-DNA glycosylase